MYFRINTENILLLTMIYKRMVEILRLKYSTTGVNTIDTLQKIKKYM